jgi:lipopolysaccharide transport system permease protein
MWKYRELIRNLTIADFKNHYQNTSLGFLWSLLSPFFTALVLWFVFRRLFQQEANYSSNLLVGIMMWRFFSAGTIICLNSIVSKPNLVTKVFVPRQILVLSGALSNLIVSLLEFLVLIPLIFVLIGHLPWTLILYPFVHIILFFGIYGLGLLLASFFVYFRDLGQIWDVVISVLIYCSPIIYPLSVVPGYLLKYYLLNPITRFVLIYRDLMIIGKFPGWSDILIGIVAVAFFFFLGNFVFEKLQRRFAEEI